jgi:hypothetical protein
MSDTPETDRIVRNAAIADHPPTRLAATLIVKCEKLERERDEARKDLEFRRELYKVQEKLLEVTRCQRDEAREVASGLAVQEERVEEAQKELSSIHRWIERNHPDGFIDSMTHHQNLERVGDRWYDQLDRVKRERNDYLDRLNEILKPIPIK